MSQKNKIASWSILRSPARQTGQNAGTGFAQPTSSEAGANPRLSRVSLTASCATIQLIQGASMLLDCRQARPLLPSWEQHTAICTRQSAYILASLVGLPLTCPLRLAAMRQGGGSNHRAISGDGPPVPTIVFHGDRDTTVHPDNGGQIFEQSVRTMSTQKKVHRGQVPGGHAYTRTIVRDASGRAMLEHWNIHGAGHAWSGGNPVGSDTDPKGPDATREMLRFFLEHSLPQQSGTTVSRFVGAGHDQPGPD